MIYRLLFAAGIYALFVQPAAAYFDPGTGSIILQLLLAGLGGLLVVWKMWWHKIKAALGFKADQDDSSKEKER